MKIAVPTLNGELTSHFGHCEKFSILEIKDNKVVREENIDPPVHQPGAYPRFLAELGVDVIIAGGMGQKARDLFAANMIQVCVGVPDGSPRELAEKYLINELETGQNLCDH